MTGQHYWLDPCKLLSLPKEILLEIITYVTFEKTLYPTSLLELSSCCKYLHHLVHKDPWRLQTIWPQVFHSRFDTKAIYRRRLHTCINWQSTFERRCKALYNCRSFALNKNDISLLDTIDWEVIWDMLTEHGNRDHPILIYRLTINNRPNQCCSLVQFPSTIDCRSVVSIGTFQRQRSLSNRIAHFILISQLW